MPTTNRERVLRYLRSIAPSGATNSEIEHATGVHPHQQVFMITQAFMRIGLIQGERQGYEWYFHVQSREPAPLPNRASHPVSASVPAPTKLSNTQFQDLARQVMSKHYGVALAHRQLPGIPKLFDLVSADGRIVGNAVYYPLNGYKRFAVPQSSIISEHVWLLEKTQAPHRFLVFANDRVAPVQWLERYGTLASAITFFFLTDRGAVVPMNF